MSAGRPQEKQKRAKQARTAETRARILAHARKAISESGFEATTTLDIARRANVAEGSVFAHFDNKQGLLLAVMQAHYLEITEHVRALAAACDDPEQLLRNLISYHLDNMRSAWPELRAFAHYGRYADTELSQAFRELNRRYTRVFMTCLEEMTSRQELASDWPLEMLRDMIFGTAEHWAFRTMELDQNLDQAQAVDFIVARLPMERFAQKIEQS